MWLLFLAFALASRHRPDEHEPLAHRKLAKGEPTSAPPPWPGEAAPAPRPRPAPRGAPKPRTGVPVPPGGGLHGSGSGEPPAPGLNADALAMLKRAGINPKTIAHLTPAQVAMFNMTTPAGMRAFLGKLVAERPGLLAKAKRTRPDPQAQPADQSAYMQQGHPGQGFAAWELWPELGWERTGNGAEARGFVQRGDSDWVHWYVGPDYSWSYDHHWGQGFDVMRSLKQAGNLVKQGLQDAGQVVHVLTQPFGSAIAAASHALDGELDKLAADLPPGARPFIEGLKDAADFVATYAETAVTLDPSKVPWHEIADTLEAGASVVPVLGTAVSDIVATAEVLYDTLTADNPLEAALEAAYTYAMASVPGAAALRPILDPVVDALIRIAVGNEPPSKAILDATLDQVPDSPSFGHLTPRNVAASLASIVVSHLGIAA